MSVNRRLQRIENKFDFGEKKTIYISTIKDYIEYAYGETSDEAEVIADERIRKIIEFED